MKTFKKFPIETATACQLKWSHSTVFLTELKTASCHRVQHNHFNLDTFDFHNIPEKLNDRKLMLEGKWPGRGCEHCKSTEDAGGTSDRMLHLDFHGYRAPPEVDSNLTAINVTPRQLEIYFSNTCNLKCIYCNPRFSSKINEENRKFGPTVKPLGVKFPGYVQLPEEVPVAVDKMFNWLDSNIHNLDQLLILGGEPFIQKETERLLNFLVGKDLPNLDLIIFSNLMIDHNKFVSYVDKLRNIKNINQLTIIGSIDCWGPTAEYIRNGLNLELFDKNYTYLVEHTNINLVINSCLSNLSIFEMPALVEKINQWSGIRTVYWSMMKVGGIASMHPFAFGPELANYGFNQSVKLFDPMGDPEKLSYKEYFKGLEKEFASSSEDVHAQQQLKIFLTELDRRRGTDYTKTFPVIANWSG